MPEVARGCAHAHARVSCAVRRASSVACQVSRFALFWLRSGTLAVPTVVITVAVVTAIVTATVVSTVVVTLLLLLPLVVLVLLILVRCCWCWIVGTAATAAADPRVLLLLLLQQRSADMRGSESSVAQRYCVMDYHIVRCFP